MITFDRSKEILITQKTLETHHHCQNWLKVDNFLYNSSKQRGRRGKLFYYVCPYIHSFGCLPHLICVAFFSDSSLINFVPTEYLYILNIMYNNFVAFFQGPTNYFFYFVNKGLCQHSITRFQIDCSPTSCLTNICKGIMSVRPK